MTREDIEKCFSYHAAGAALEYYEQEHSQSSRIESCDVVNAFEAGAEWAQEFMIKKACEWLLNNAHLYVYATTREKRALLFYNFKKAMEE